MDYAKIHHYISLALRQYKMRQAQALSLSSYPSSQNHRLAEVGNDLWKLSGPAFLLKQDHLEQVTEDCVQMAFGYFQGGRLHILHG